LFHLCTQDGTSPLPERKDAGNYESARPFQRAIFVNGYPASKRRVELISFFRAPVFLAYGYYLHLNA